VSEAIFAATEAANVICLALAAAAIIEAAAAAAKVAAAAAVPIVIGVVAHAMILRNARPPSIPKPPTTNPRTGSNGGKTAYGQ
jgi:chitinase